MSKHTPGPWAVREHWSDDGAFEVYPTRGGKKPSIGEWSALAEIPEYGPDDAPEAEANARLIAASPDLYAVLKELQESAAYWSEYDVPLGIVDRINQAIAKAEEA